MDSNESPCGSVPPEIVLLTKALDNMEGCGACASLPASGFAFSFAAAASCWDSLVALAAPLATSFVGSAAKAGEDSRMALAATEETSAEVSHAFLRVFMI